MEVHSGRTEDGVDLIAIGAFEPISVHAVFAFQVADARFDGGPTFHPTPKRSCRSSASALVHMNVDFSLVAVPSIAHVHKDMIRRSGNPLDLG